MHKFLLGVQSHRIEEDFVADGAGVGVPTVDPRVCAQTMLGFEASVADSADRGALLIVDLHVLLQLRVGLEGLLADGAGVWLGAAMVLHMDLEILFQRNLFGPSLGPWAAQ